MVQYNKLAYFSQLNYPRIVLNTKRTIQENETLTIPHPLGTVPHFRVWGELFPGEFSIMFTSSAQYMFTSAYSNANLFGYQVEVDAANVYITSYNTGTKTVYLRVYAS